jgi:hypothetical protein
MAKRGRPSAASLEVQTAVIDVVARPDAPYDLSDEESEEWWAVVNRMPADWFPRETHAMLAQYCRHVVGARRIDQLIKAAEKGAAVDLERYDRLLKMRERESRIMSSLANRMRLTQQATTRIEQAKKPTGGELPWEFK